MSQFLSLRIFASFCCSSPSERVSLEMCSITTMAEVEDSDFFLSSAIGEEERLFVSEKVKTHSKYLLKPRREIEHREYFDPFHPERAQSDSPSRPSPTHRGTSTYLDEYSSVAGQYFKDIIIPRVPSRRSRARGHSITDSEVSIRRQFPSTNKQFFSLCLSVCLFIYLSLHLSVSVSLS
jgi:hypothetical protein